MSSNGDIAAVAGATGYLGKHVVQALHEAGFRVRALARAPGRLAEARPFCDDIYVGEATRHESVASFCDGARVLFSSIGVRNMKRRPTIWDVDFGANAALIDVARQAGVEHVVFVSVFRAAETRSTCRVAEARERVVDKIMASGMRWTVLRPTGFFNDMAEFFQMARRGRVWLPGDGTTRLNPIHGADIAEVVVREVTRTSPDGAVLNLGGPETFSMREIGELAFQVLGRPARFGRIPFGLLRAGSTLSRPFNENASALLEMFALMSGVDGIAPAVGKRRLEDFFRELAARGDGNGDGDGARLSVAAPR